MLHLSSNILKLLQRESQKEQSTKRKSLSKKMMGAERVCIQTREEECKRRRVNNRKCQKEGSSKEMMDEDKETDEVGLSTEDEVSTAKEGVSTDFEKVSTDRPKLSTDDLKVSTDEQMEKKVESTAEQKESTEEQTKEEFATQASQTSTQTPTSMIFGDDETIATLLINMSKAKAISKEKEKAVKKFKQLESDGVCWLGKSKRVGRERRKTKLLKKKQQMKVLIINIDDVKALRFDGRSEYLLKASRSKKREQFTIEERAKFLYEYIAAKRKFLDNTIQALEIKPPTKNQLRNQMITYLKHVVNLQHVIEEQEGSAQDEGLIKKMNEKEVVYLNLEVIKETPREVKDEIGMEYKYQKKKTGSRMKDNEVDMRFLTGKISYHDWKTSYVLEQNHREISKWLFIISGNAIIQDEMPERRSNFKEGNSGVQMLNLRLESDEENTIGIRMIWFIKKGINLTLGFLGEELASPRSNSEAIGCPASKWLGVKTSQIRCWLNSLPLNCMVFKLTISYDEE
ncbi:hypothetical protein Tco_0949897 [Tanacetum coccineum]